MSSEHHWDSLYRETRSDELGWYEPTPSTLGLLTKHSDADESVIDVGGGVSQLADALLDLGHRDLTVLDLSSVALERSRGRLGERSEAVAWIVADVTEFVPDRTWDLWHDRAVFHFLVEPADRQAYKHAAVRAMAPGGRLVIAAFAADGPESCAGLPVARYDQEGLSAAFSPEFDLIEAERMVAGHDVGDRRPYVVAVFALAGTRQ